MDAIISLTGAERGFLGLFDEKRELRFMAARNMARETLEEEDFAISRSVIQTVAESGEQVVTTNASTDPRFAEKVSVVTHQLRSIQCVPLRTRGQTIGVFYVDNRIRSGVFDEADLEMLSAFAAQAAMAIENARLFTRSTRTRPTC
jgi:sigma-B regulation protein RsbU (phosphoserine phosphatase)